MSVSRRPSTSRPVSAIFVGKLDISKDLHEPLTRSRTSLLPSPPHTNSNSSGTGSTGRSNVRSPFTESGSAMDNQTTEKRPASRASFQDNQHGNNDDDDHDRRSSRRTNDEYDEDHTAKLSDDRRSAGNSSTGTPSVKSGGSTGVLSRAKSLADRNRAVLDKLASITSGSSRMNSRSPALAPRTSSARENSISSRSSGDSKSQPRSATSSRLSFPQSRGHTDQPRLQRTPASGSDTEREPRSPDDFSVTPPAYSYDDGPRISSIDTIGSVRRSTAISASPETLTNDPLALRQSSENSTLSTFRGTLREDTTSSTFGATKYKAKSAKRAPLPQEFRDGTASSEEPESATTSASGSISPVMPKTRNNPFSSSTSTTTSEASSSSSRREPSLQPSLTHSSSSSRVSAFKRSSTVREPGAGARARLSHARWVSEADGSGPNTEGPASQNPHRYERRGGSAESAIAGRPSNHMNYQNPATVGRRTLFGEEIRAAGLSPRRERFPERTLSNDSPSLTDLPHLSRDAESAGMNLPSGFLPPSSGAYGTMRDQPYQSRSRDGVGTEQPVNDFHRSPVRTISTFSRSRPTSSGPDRFNQSVRASLGLGGTSRPSTSVGMYASRERDRDQDRNDRIAPFVQRSMGSQPVQQATRRASPFGDRDDRRSNTPSFRPTSAAYRHPLTSSPSNAANGDHPDILVDALNLLETNLTRMTALGGTATLHTHDCARAAEVLAEQMRTLNTRLRAATSSALEEHIEADLASAGDEQIVREAGIWKGVGAEFRESLRASDELVRSLTTFFLSFGKLLKDSGGSGTLTPGRREGGPPHRHSESANQYGDGPSSPPRAQSRNSHDGGAFIRRTIDAPGRVATNANSAVDEWGQRLYAAARLPTSDGGRRSLDGNTSIRRSMDQQRDLNGVDPYIRSSTSMSHVRGRASPLSPTSLDLSNQPRRPSVFSALTSRRFFSGSTARGSNEKNQPAAAPVPSSSRTDDKSFGSDDQAYESPTPAERNKSFRRTLRRSLPFKSEHPTVQRPPLPTVLPESRTLPRKDRRNKASTTSNATVRGSSIQLGSGGLQPTTQLTTTPVISNGLTEHDLHQHDLDLPPSLGRSAGAAILTAVNERGEGFTRKRTISAVSGSSVKLESGPSSAVSPTSHHSFADLREDRSSDSSRGRRGTIGGLFH